MKKTAKVFVISLATLTSAVCLTGCPGGGNYNSDKEYTYYTYLTTKPSTWNTHDWETNDESYVTSFTEIGFYDVILDESKSNYKFVTEMAREFPVKISSSDLKDNEIDEYSENYFNGQNIPENQIFDIKLNKNATWEDGTKITAQDYIDSLQRQLSPKYVNFRADSYYSSNLVVANAEKYYKSGRSTLEPLYNYVNSNYEYTDTKYDESAGTTYYLNLQKTAPIAAEKFTDGKSVTLSELFNQTMITSNKDSNEAARRISESVKYFLFKYGPKDWKTRSDNHEDWAKAESPADVKDAMTNYDIALSEYSKTKQPIKVRKNLGDNGNGGYNYSDWKNENELVTYTRADLVKDINTILKNAFGKTIKDKSERLLLYGYIKNDEFDDFSKVGIKDVGDDTIRLILGKSIKLLDLKFSLTSNWLVKTDLYDKLSTKSGSKWSTDYASKKVENYKSYGPYKLVKYEEGKSFVIEKNDKWYGYTDGQHEGQFQMTRVKTTIIEDHSTAVGMFEKGELDDLTLDSNDMAKYGNSRRSQTVYESFTQKISFNSDRSKLTNRQSNGVNKVILANDDFRKGLSLSLNRTDFASKTTAGSKAFTGLLNDLYLTDVQTGEMYTSTSQGKGVYNDVYGELGGDPYTSSEKTALSTDAQGYNLQQATYFVEKAITTEIEANRLKLNDKIELEIQVYDNSSTTTINMTNFIRDSFKTVVANAVAKYNEKQTDAAKKSSISFDLKVTKNEDYYNAAKSGNYDMIFSIWGGAAINPYGLMQVYCDPTFESTCEYGFKGHQNETSNNLTINFGTTKETRTISDWYEKLNGDLAEMDIDEMVSSRDSEDEAEKELVAKYNEQHSKRVTVLAKLEAAILKRFEAIPLVARGSTSLYSLKVKYATNKYINLVGYGGIRFMTFNYSDKAWNEFIKSKDYSSNLYK